MLAFAIIVIAARAPFDAVAPTLSRGKDVTTAMIYTPVLNRGGGEFVALQIHG